MVVVNYLLTGMILQVGWGFTNPKNPWEYHWILVGDDHTEKKGGGIELRLLLLHFLKLLLDPKTMKNEGFTPPKYGL